MICRKPLLSAKDSIPYIYIIYFSEDGQTERQLKSNHITKDTMLISVKKKKKKKKKKVH